jgi:hypothetical protein
MLKKVYNEATKQICNEKLQTSQYTYGTRTKANEEG